MLLYDWGTNLSTVPPQLIPAGIPWALILNGIVIMRLFDRSEMGMLVNTTLIKLLSESVSCDCWHAIVIYFILLFFKLKIKNLKLYFFTADAVVKGVDMLVDEIERDIFTFRFLATLLELAIQ